MDQETIGRVSWAWTVAAVVLGIVLVVVGNTLMTEVGVVVLILGLLGLMPALRFTWLAEG